MLKTLREKLRHPLATRGTLAISGSITLLALGIYYVTFIGEKPGAISDYVSRLEAATLDTRFQLRGPATPDSRVVIVDIDQRSQEILGRWPFHRGHFAHLLDRLREDGAKVVAFDVTFSQPDNSIASLQTVRKRLEEKSVAAPPAVSQELQAAETEFDYDAQFATAIERSEHVVLGNFFLYTDSDLRGLDKATLERFAQLASYHPFPQVRPISETLPPEARIDLIKLFEERGILPRGAEANLDRFAGILPADTSSAGFFNVFTEPDGVVRRGQLALPYGAGEDFADWDIFASLDVQALRFFLNASGDDVALYFSPQGVDHVNIGSLIIKPDDLGRVIINYRGGTGTYPYISMADVTLGKFQPGTFKDKIVLVGASATGIGDLRATPFNANHPGVEIHANIIDNALNNAFLKRTATQVIFDISAIIFFGVPYALLLGLLPPRWVALGLLVLAPFLIIVQYTFHQGWWLNVVTPAVLTAIPNTVALAFYRMRVEEKEKRRVRGAFQQYVSPEVIRRLLENPEKVRPRKIEITTLFSDVRGFTSIAERMDAQELAHLLNDYFTQMTRIVFTNQGTLDKYIGDAVMAFWGAPFEEPNHSQRACRAALDMQRGLRELRADWRKQGKPLLEIGIGINTGFASVGIMGSVGRHNYTAIGDAVNLAARLEGLNRLYGTRVLVGETTRAQDTRQEYIFRELDWIRVKGKSQPSSIFELLGYSAEKNQWHERVERFHAGLSFYRQREWRQAQTCFHLVLERWPDDGPARLFVQRCEEFLREAPDPQWDGVYTATEK